MSNTALSLDSSVGQAERRAPRHRAFLRARLIYLDGSVTYDCQVTQISDTGAKITIADAANLPERFYLDIPQKRTKARARLVRREPGNAAVAFEPEEERRDASAVTLIEQIRALEAENKALRATCRSLTEQLERTKASY